MPHRRGARRAEVGSDMSALPMPCDADVLLQALRLGGSAETKIVDRTQLANRPGRFVTHRCRVRLEGGRIVTVIAKQADPGEYRPRDPDSGLASAFFTEWASLKLLAEIAPGATGAPRIIAGDADTGLLLIEDIGAGEDLAIRLLLGDSAGVADDLTALARLLGRMHAATSGTEEAFLALRRALGASNTPNRSAEARRVVDWGRQAVEACRGIGLGVDAGVADEVRGLAEAVERPGRLLVFSHGDICPDNLLRGDAGPRLIDFEQGRYRHAALDVAAILMAFPGCWCVGAIPSETADQALAGYRENGPADRADLDAGMAYWLLHELADKLDRAWLNDWSFGLTTARRSLRGRLEAFCRSSSPGGPYRRLRILAAALLDRIRVSWPEIVPYPSFSRRAPIARTDVDGLAAAIVDGRIGDMRAILARSPSLAATRRIGAKWEHMLQLAVSAKRVDAAEVLLEHGAAIGEATDDEGRTPLNTACGHGDVAMIRLLLSRGADADSPNTWGYRPLHYACGPDRGQVYDLLISAGAKPDIMVAVYLNRVEEVREHIRRDAASANLRFGNGSTVLLGAVAKGDAAAGIVEELLRAGANVHARAIWGSTALHSAAEKGAVAVARLLLRHGAEAGARDRQGRTAADTARAAGHPDLAAELQAAAG